MRHNQKFSSQNFESLGLNTEESKRLTNKLSISVHSRLKETLKNKLLEIVKKMNSEGHSLREYHESDSKTFSCVEYRDDFEDQESYHCKLRISIDLSIYSGYPHFISDEEMAEE